jgi:methyl-accepting chemotaxis protein
MKRLLVFTWIETWKKLYGDNIDEILQNNNVDTSEKGSPLDDFDEALLEKIIKEISEKNNITRSELMKKTGKENIKTFFKWYPLFFKKKSALAFLASMDTVHELLTRRLKGLTPPRIIYEPINSTEAYLIYKSKREFSDYFLGLIEGVAEKFNEKIDVNIVEKGKDNNLNYLKVHLKSEKPYVKMEKMKIFNIFSLGIFKTFQSLFSFLMPIVVFILSYLSFTYINNTFIAGLVTAVSFGVLSYIGLTDYKKGSKIIKDIFENYKKKNFDYPVKVKGAKEITEITDDFYELTDEMRKILLGVTGDVQEIEGAVTSVSNSANNLKD